MRLAGIILMHMFCGAGCIAERTIDAIIDEHGVTWLPETSGTETVDTTTGTSSSSSSTRPDIASSETSGSTGDTTVLTLTASEETSSETGSSPDLPSPPECGNGVIEGEESCDDANDVPDDGCHACAKDSILFVSSELYQGSELGGLGGADQRCRGLAAMAGLPRFATYRAWLSSQTTAAKDRLLQSRGRYVLVNGLVVAQDWNELTSGTLQRPIDVDEHSETNPNAIWTGTTPDGSIAAGTTQCDDWTAQELGQQAVIGDSASFNMWWTLVGPTWCGDFAALYCIEQ